MTISTLICVVLQLVLLATLAVRSHVDRNRRRRLHDRITELTAQVDLLETCHDLLDVRHTSLRARVRANEQVIPGPTPPFVNPVFNPYFAPAARCTTPLSDLTYTIPVFIK